MESNQNKKIILKCSTFIIFIFVVLYCVEYTLSYFVTKSDIDQTGKINLIMQHQIDPEIIIFGSSVAEVGFDTRVLEKKINKSIYNLAIDGTPVLKSEFLIDEFLQYSKKCKTVIIGLAFFSLSEQKEMVQPSRFIAYKDNKYVKNNIKTVSPNLYNKLYNRPFYSFIAADQTYYKNVYRGFEKKFLKSSVNKDFLKGFVPHIESYDDTSLSINQQKIKVSKEVIDRYIQLIKKIQKHNINVKLVLLPMYIKGQLHFNNYSEYIDEIKLLSLKTNTDFYDFSSDSIVRNKIFFYNNGHLNNLGANEFSNKFATILNK